MRIIRSETLGRRSANAKSLAKILAERLTKSLAETLDETFHARQAFPQSLGSDCMHGSPQDSPRLAFLRGLVVHIISVR